MKLTRAEIEALKHCVNYFAEVCGFDKTNKSRWVKQKLRDAENLKSIIKKAEGEK